MLKVLFAGTPDVAVPSLKMLAEDTERFEVVAVLTRPDAPTGRGRKLVPNPVKQAALDLGLPVIESDPSEETFISELAATGAQAAAVVAYGKILKQDVLDALPMGWYNLHFSLLPQWRGAAPVQRSIWAGEKVTGATVFRIVRAMDAGPILAQSTVEIGAHETAGELLNRLAEDGSRLLAASLQAMADDQIAPVEQPAGAYEVAQKITVEDAHIRFDIPVFAVDRQIRACTPNPGAWCELHANAEAEPATLHVLRAQGADMSNPNTPVSLEPGRIVAGKKNVWVGTSSDPLELLEVKAQGKKAMRAADWARGAHLDNIGFCYIATRIYRDSHHRRMRINEENQESGSNHVRSHDAEHPPEPQAWRRTPRQARRHESSADHWPHHQPQQSGPY